MNKDKTTKWLTAAGVRAVKTVAQSALGGILSILTSVVTGLPEVK